MFHSNSQSFLVNIRPYIVVILGTLLLQGCASRPSLNTTFYGADSLKFDPTLRVPVFHGYVDDSGVRVVKTPSYLVSNVMGKTMHMTVSRKCSGEIVYEDTYTPNLRYSNTHITHGSVVFTDIGTYDIVVSVDDKTLTETFQVIPLDDATPGTASQTLDGYSAPTLGILPFEVSSRLPDNPRYAFERILFPVSLVLAVQRQAGICPAQVVFITTESPTCDFTVSGRILESSGLKTTLSLTMRDLTGTTIWTKQLTVEPKVVNGALRIRSGGPRYGYAEDGYWEDIAPAIATSLSQQAHEDARADRRAYRASQLVGRQVTTEQLRGDDRLIALIDKLSLLELNSLLAVASEHAMRKVQQPGQAYNSWQVATIANTQQAHAARSRASVATAFALLGAAGSVASSYNAARYGTIDTSAQLNSQVMSFAAVAADANDEAAQLSDAVIRLDTSFGNEIAPTSIELEDELFTLTGTFTERLQQYRDRAGAVLRRRLGL